MRKIFIALLIVLLPAFSFADEITRGNPWRKSGTNTILTTTSDNVGIGNTSPAYKLEVDGTFDATTITQGGVAIPTASGTTNYISKFTGASALGNSSLFDNGNIGLGTTAPLGLLQVGTSPTPGLFVTTAGNVGIGKTSPSQKLDVAGTIAGTTITGANVTSGADPGHTHGSSSITEADPLAILTNGTRGLSGDWDNGDFDISTIGNIGIGNTNPLVLLDVGSSPSVGLKALAGGNVGIATTNPNAPLTVIGAGFITGNLGIGVTNPQNYALYVSGDEYITGSSYQGDNYKVIGDIGANGNVGAGISAPLYRLDIRGSGNAILNMTGNVGIGTTNPIRKLDVVGNIRASGSGTFNTLSITDLIDISSQTNLSGDTENVLTGDALSIASAITRDAEWNGLDFLVGTATGTLSAEIVAGTAPSGELGGTWASPTIDDSLAVTSWTLTTPIFSGIVNTDNNWLSGDGGAEGLMIDDSGNVGIGTTGPLGLLQVGTSPTPGLIVLSNGNMGIGTTNPLSKFEVRGEVGIYNTKPLFHLNIETVGTSASGPMMKLSTTKNYRITSVTGLVQGGTNAIYSLYQVGTSGTGPAVSLNVGLTAPISALTVTSGFGVGSTIPKDTYLRITRDTVNSAINFILDGFGEEY